VKAVRKRNGRPPHLNCCWYKLAFQQSLPRMTIDFKVTTFTFLQVLHLTNNRLMELPQRLPESLAQLMLSYNLISQLGREAFIRSSNIVDIALDHNMIGRRATNQPFNV